MTDRQENVLVLENPHEHDWRVYRLGRWADRYDGLLEDADQPLRCLVCGDHAGDWSQVPVYLSFSVDAAFTVEELWPDAADRPAKITAAAVTELMKRAGRRTVLGDWGLMPVRLDIDVQVRGESMGTVSLI